MKTPQIIIHTIGTTLFLFLSGCTTLSNLQRAAALSDPEFAAYDGLKRTIAVLEFEDETELGQGKVGSAIADMVTGVLVRSGRFVVIERSQLEQILQEQGLGQSGIITDASAVQVGKLSGAHMLVMGRLNELQFKSGRHDFNLKEDEESGLSLAASVGLANVSFKVVETETGQVLLADQFNETDFRPGFGVHTKEWAFQDLEDFNETVVGVATRKCVNKITVAIVNNATFFPWSGKVIKVDSTNIFFTPGQRAGVKFNQIFAIYASQPGESEEKIPIGSVQVIDFIGERVSKALVKDGQLIAPGDIVREFVTPADNVEQK